DHREAGLIEAGDKNTRTASAGDEGVTVTSLRRGADDGLQGKMLAVIVAVLGQNGQAVSGRRASRRPGGTAFHGGGSFLVQPASRGQHVAQKGGKVVAQQLLVGDVEPGREAA